MKTITFKKAFIGTVITLLVCSAYLFIAGYRFTPLQAVKASFNVSGTADVFGKVERDWATVLLLNTDDGIKTALVEKREALWHCGVSTYLYDDIIKDDKVKTVGWISNKSEDNKQITVFAVQSTDPAVKLIEAGPESDRQQISISPNETFIFSWDKVIQWNELNAVAIDEDNNVLYTYQYNPATPNITRAEELRWYSAQSN